MLEFTLFGICVVLHEKIEHLNFPFERASLSILAQFTTAFKIYHSRSSLEVIVVEPDRLDGFVIHDDHVLVKFLHDVD